MSMDFAIRTAMFFKDPIDKWASITGEYKLMNMYRKNKKKYDALYNKIRKRKCRVCWCTENNACSGWCQWVGIDLCSACIDAI